jgi:two-component system, OmpR family, phosphate regulon response regulator PhoB
MNRQRILIVEDEEDILNLLRFNLQNSGFDVITSGDGREALELARKYDPDLILLDLMLPGLDGFEVCRELKSDPKTRVVPVIMLTARGEEVDRIVGLELGADDYVVKPFSPRELTLRVKAVLRRGEAGETENASWQRDGMKVDFERHLVEVNGRDVALTATEFKLLTEIIQARGKVLTRDSLLSRVWGYEFDGYARTVDTHVRRLRQKLGPHANLVETVRGVGYRFKE